MKKTIRCCISCILPCGALDVIRIVHTNGRVEEITGTIRAADVMKLHPKHVLKKPSSCSAAAAHDGIAAVVVPKIVIVPPDAELQRGKIYFLMPLPPDHHRSSKKKDRHRSSGRSNTSSSDHSKRDNSMSLAAAAADVLVSSSDDRYLSEIMSEKVSSATERDHRRRGRAGVWRPHLESISESAFLNIASTHDDDDSF